MPTGSKPSYVDVLVVGAGPTGLTLAAELRAYGVQFRIIDRHLDRVHESRALAIQPRTLEVLARHQLAGPLVAAGNQGVQVRMHAGSRTVSLRLFDLGITDTAYPYLLFLSQAETERILDEHLRRQQVTVERGVELRTVQQNDTDVTCRVRDAGGVEETVTARYVVGCDGARSTVREQAGIAFEGHAYPQTFLLADLEADGLETGVVHAFLGRAGMMFFFPLGRPATWRMLAMKSPGDPAAEVTIDLLQAITDRSTAGSVRLRDPVWLTDFRLHNRGASAYRAGRVFLAGDAAHIHSPAGAQGMNTGIQDAVNLGWKLALALRGATDPLLHSYHLERAPIGRAVLRYTDRIFTIATTSTPLSGAVRTHVAPRLAPLALHLRPIRAYAFRTVSQLGIRYRGSPLSTPSPRWWRGPRPGDRLPDAPIVHNGQPSSLHESIVTPGFHVLLCGPAAAWPTRAAADLEARWKGLVTVHHLTRDDTPGALHDRGGLALRRLGVRGRPGCLLIRPDGHVACRSRGSDPSGVTSYLTRWLPPTTAAPDPGPSLVE
jgi:2-polyprenyl-6-methoxyphenol hydroxylase-like FAD-dependent oxidoreductase